MAKKDLRMSAEEVSAFLATRSGEIIAVVAGAEQAAPCADLARFEFDDGCAIFRTGIAASVVAQLARDDRVCCIVDQRSFEGDEDDYFNTRSAMLHGHATRIASEDGAAFAVTIANIVSFDFAKLRTDPAAMAD